MDAVTTTSLPSYALSPTQMMKRLRALEKAYPDLVEIRDIGDSAAKLNGGKGHDLFAIVLTDEKSHGEKSLVGHLGAIHGSELVAPTLFTEFAEQIVKGFSREVRSTYLLKNREIHLIPMINPDGVVRMHKLLSGKPGGEYGRHNSNGVDLNRNFPFGWGGNGASVDPAYPGYRGAAPASEPETQAVMKYFTENKPSILVDWHNQGELNLYAWGETTLSGPTSAGQRDFAMRISAINQHKAQPAAALYPTSGSTVDWSHGVLGATSLVIESGKEDFLTDEGFVEIRRKNMPALFELAGLADDPVEHARGPVVSSWNIWKDNNGAKLDGRISEQRSGNDAIAAAELVFDPIAKPGSGLKLDPLDGAFDSADEAFALSVEDAVPQVDMAYVRARDAKGNWGELSPAWLAQPNPPAPK